MAKSLRSKSKRAFRAKKREFGKYVAAEAARLHRLNAKLAAVKDTVPIEEEQEAMMDAAEDAPRDAVSDAEVDDGALEEMAVDGSGQPDKKPGAISTHGPRRSRREEWRKSKGLVPVPRRRGMNPRAGSKAGKPSRK